MIESLDKVALIVAGVAGGSAVQAAVRVIVTRGAISGRKGSRVLPELP